MPGLCTEPGSGPSAYLGLNKWLILGTLIVILSVRKWALPDVPSGYRRAQTGVSAFVKRRKSVSTADASSAAPITAASSALISINIDKYQNNDLTISL